jgi:integrase
VATYQKRGKRWRAIIRKRGQVHTKSFPTKTLAKEWARKIEYRIDVAEVYDFTPADGITLKELLNSYIADVSPHNAIGRSKAAVLSMWSDRYGALELPEINQRKLKDFIRIRLREGASGITISVDLSYLKTVFKWARAVEQINAPISAVESAREALVHMHVDTRSNERDRRPTDDELEALFDSWNSNDRIQMPIVDIVQLAIATAMRQSEITALLWNDLDIEKRMVLVRGRKDPRKKNRDEWVPLLDKTGFDALAIIKRQPKTAGRIFPYNSRSVSAQFTRTCKKLEIVDLHFHDLRHEGTSRLFESGYRIEQVALVTGHKDWKQLRRYANLRPEDLHNV